MSRVLESGRGGKEIRIRFPYDKALLKVVKNLPGRRWHPDARYWSVPGKHLPEVTEALLPLGFQVSEEVRVLISEAGGPIPDEAPREAGTLSVSQLNEQVRGVLRDSFHEPLWLEGEVLGYERNSHKRHVYFQLAEKEEGDDRSRAVITVVLFEYAKELVERELARAAEPVTVQDGVRIRVRGRVDLYPPAGSYQFVIEEIDPDFTLGEIGRRRERILAELERRGLRERNLQLSFPQPALRIALVTSYGSDAYNDFVNELGRSGYTFRVDVYDCHVQGAQLENDLLAAMSRIQAHSCRYDVAAIVRGGGSRTDLMGFDSLPLALEVAQLPLKVMVGIGHHRDRGVLDFIAHSEKTPTAVAQLLVGIAAAQEERLRVAAAGLKQRSQGLLRESRERLERTSLLLARSLELRLQQARSRVLLASRDLLYRVVRRWERQRALLMRATERLPTAVTHLLSRTHERLEGKQSRIRSADPRQVLARGYSWLRKGDGSSLKRVGQASVGDRITALLSDGELDARVEGKREGSKK
ncbi:MAG: exodeoxyribonuclease VII large subunit [Planctomycetota bacterium]